MTEGLKEDLSATSLDADMRKISKEESPVLVARHVAEAVHRYLARLDPHEQRVRVNRVLQVLAGSDDAKFDALTSPPEVLQALHVPKAPKPARPLTPLSEVALLTNASGEPNLANEIAQEIESADQVDLLCAFIRFAGISVIGRQLQRLADRGVPFRVITTTYRGATERRALDDLVEKYGAEVKVRYETEATRLHAKAWLFRRNSGFDTGYVGSSNLSKSALVDGLEWNVRISSVATESLTRKFEATFDTYWQDPAFEQYIPERDRARLDEQLLVAGGAGSSDKLVISGLQVRPYPHQERILEALEAARVNYDRHKNLVVAATGTGKTVVAALDYARLCEEASNRPTLLFVAHRKEILEQSLRTYREVLADGAFGELLVDGRRPSEWRHVFASVQSLHRDTELDLTSFDVVVIDEFHHAAAPTYDRLLRESAPKELLGLTATPERADGRDVTQWFDGRIAYELRLWDALGEDLLCPFHYYGIADNTDLRNVAWTRGRYKESALSEVYTGNHQRARLILQAVRDKILDPTKMKALGFCVDTHHARFMAETFNQQGLKSVAVLGTTPATERSQAVADLVSGEIQCIFAVDVFNEGLDIPSIDTVLMLRPTESATIFLQQLGRGLRRTAGKALLTVLDFIGFQRAEFRFAPKIDVLTSSSPGNRQELVNPFMPGASQVVFDAEAQRIILDNLKRTIPATRKALVADIRERGVESLREFLATGGTLAEIYAGASARQTGWTPLARDAGLDVLPPGPFEDDLATRIRAFLHTDDFERSDAYRKIVDVAGPDYAQMSVTEQALARMLVFTVWSDRGGHDTFGDALETFRQHPALCAELAELVDIQRDHITHVPEPLSARRPDCPLYTHAHYRREEILAAIGFADETTKARGQAGGLVWSGDTAALFVNLHKDERSFTPNTMYRDYAESPELFHWESPNTTRVDSDMGQRLIGQPTNGVEVLLFVRDSPTGRYGSQPFMFLGPVDYVSHHGERPIAFRWKLRRRMPADVYERASVVAS